MTIVDVLQKFIRVDNVTGIVRKKIIIKKKIKIFLVQVRIYEL